MKDLEITWIKTPVEDIMGSHTQGLMCGILCIDFNYPFPDTCGVYCLGYVSD